MPAFVAAALGGTVRGSFEAGACAGRWTTWICRPTPAGRSHRCRVVQSVGRGGDRPAPRRRNDAASRRRTAGPARRPPAAGRADAGGLSSAATRQEPGASQGTTAGAAGWRGPGHGLREWSQDVPVRCAWCLPPSRPYRPQRRRVPFRHRSALHRRLYFVITTITTIGYGDYNLKHAPPWMKLYGLFVMLCGAAMVAMLFGIVDRPRPRARLRELLARGCAHSRAHHRRRAGEHRLPTGTRTCPRTARPWWRSSGGRTVSSCRPRASCAP